LPFFFGRETSFKHGEMSHVNLTGNQEFRQGYKLLICLLVGSQQVFNCVFLMTAFCVFTEHRLNIDAIFVFWTSFDNLLEDRLDIFFVSFVLISSRNGRENILEIALAWFVLFLDFG
jgi:hypothetical protein